MQSMVPDRLRRRWTDKKIGKKKFSCSTFMLYLGLEGIDEELAHHTIYLSEGLPQEHRGDRGRAHAAAGAFVLRAERVRDRS